MTFNLLEDRWIPVRRRSGAVTLIAPWEITDQDDPPITVDATRAAWNAALTEFLISLTQTVFLPEDASAWRAWREKPPAPEEIKKGFALFLPFFQLEGKKAFMQDPTLLIDKRNDDYRKPIQKLLVDGVSEQQDKNNSDLFERSGAISGLCAACTATALWDMQAHAPQGSAGYFTSLRGGGPVSTIVVGDTLWETVWANVLEQAALDMKGRPEPTSFFPWLKPESKKLKPGEVCPLHVYWGMPRRVILEKPSDGICDLCNRTSEVYRSFLSHRGGFQYAETDWRHPLSPYIRSKEGGWLVRATEPDLAGYRHYMGILVDTPAGDGIPALVVRRAIERKLDLRLWGYGYACDQASVVSWCEGVMPVETGKGAPDISPFARTLVALSQRAIEKLTDSLRGVWDRSQAGAIEKAVETGRSLWRLTEPAFSNMIVRAAKEERPVLLDEWTGYIRRIALSIYRKALPRTRVDAGWAARFEHRLSGQLSDRNPITLKTRKYGDWRIDEAV